jgi:hypothetical protein
MRFLADMGLDTRVVKWLKDKGHDAKHLRDEGLQKVPNIPPDQSFVYRTFRICRGT